MKIMLATTSTLAIMFTYTKHPLSMMMIIIMQTFIIAMMTGMMMGSFWFSYIIMIIMMSGMLVLLIYMASIASNEKFSMSIKLIMLSSFIMVTMLIMTKEINESVWSMKKLSFSMNNLFNTSTMLITLLMVIYLLFTMITVSKIVNINEGSLRIKK
uniref:NADH dehydrogenase subunit 6 n=1 Tax=Crompus oculatus TaxID=2813432 RepID=A0A8T9ZXY7_9HEMI|nr:NADH dehydrogenase subunit 6 [Crompus oculatus]